MLLLLGGAALSEFFGPLTREIALAHGLSDNLHNYLAEPIRRFLFFIKVGTEGVEKFVGTF